MDSLSSSSSDSNSEAITGINITPLVDIALVLLIVFLVTAKLVVANAQVIPLDVPRIPGKSEEVQMTLAISIDEHGALFLDDRAIATPAALSAAAHIAHDRNKDVRAVIRASSKTEHGAVVQVIDALRTAEVTRIAFAVQKSTPTSTPSGPPNE